MMKKVKLVDGKEVVINFGLIEAIEVNEDNSRTIVLVSGNRYIALESEVRFQEEPSKQ